MATLYLTFTAPNPIPALGYLVKYRVNSPQGAWSSTVMPQSSGPIQIGGLTSATVYDIEVYARCGVGENVTLSLVASDTTTTQTCNSYEINNPSGGAKIAQWRPCGAIYNTSQSIGSGTSITVCAVAGTVTVASGGVISTIGACIPPL
jgi:hypothetical protein